MASFLGIGGVLFPRPGNYEIGIVHTQPQQLGD